MSVHYKFFARNGYRTIIFDGHITLKELRERIMARERLKPKNCELEISEAQSRKEYTDDEAHIPKDSSVIVRRLPVGGVVVPGKTFTVYQPLVGLTGPTDSCPMSAAKLLKTAKMVDGNASREDKSKAVTEAHEEGKKNPMCMPAKHLLCPICNGLMIDAMLMPCCGESFCHGCIRTDTCFTCKQSVVSPDSVIANMALRQAVINFKNEMENTHLPSMSSPAPPAPAASPTPTPAAAPTPAPAAAPTPAPAAAPTPAPAAAPTPAPASSPTPAPAAAPTTAPAAAPTPAPASSPTPAPAAAPTPAPASSPTPAPAAAPTTAPAAAPTPAPASSPTPAPAAAPTPAPASSPTPAPAAAPTPAPAAAPTPAPAAAPTVIGQPSPPLEWLSYSPGHQSQPHQSYRREGPPLDPPVYPKPYMYPPPPQSYPPPSMYPPPPPQSYPPPSMYPPPPPQSYPPPSMYPPPPPQSYPPPFMYPPPSPQSYPPPSMYPPPPPQSYPPPSMYPPSPSHSYSPLYTSSPGLLPSVLGDKPQQVYVPGPPEMSPPWVTPGNQPPRLPLAEAERAGHYRSRSRSRSPGVVRIHSPGGRKSPRWKRPPYELKGQSPGGNKRLERERYGDYHRGRGNRDQERYKMSPLPRYYSPGGREERDAPLHHPPSSSSSGTKSSAEVKTKNVKRKRTRDDSEPALDRTDAAPVRDEPMDDPLSSKASVGAEVAKACRMGERMAKKACSEDRGYIRPLMDLQVKPQTQRRIKLSRGRWIKGSTASSHRAQSGHKTSALD